MPQLEEFIVTRPPTALRPLLGLTVLIVEDSRFACEAVRMMCMKSGARIRRADSLTSAMKHLTIYMPSVVIVDIGLPDGSGLDLICQLAAARPRIEVIFGSSGDLSLEQAALEAGADAFLAKPIPTLADFQTAILSLLPSERQPPGPRSLDTQAIRPDRLAYRDDLSHAEQVLDAEAPTPDELCYISRFLEGVAKSAADGKMAKAARDLFTALDQDESLDEPLETLTSLVKTRLQANALI